MPAKSKAQWRFMKAVESGDVKGKGVPTREQAREFTKGQSPKGLPAHKKKGGK